MLKPDAAKEAVQPCHGHFGHETLQFCGESLSLRSLRSLTEAPRCSTPEPANAFSGQSGARASVVNMPAAGLTMRLDHHTRSASV